MKQQKIKTAEYPFACTSENKDMPLTAEDEYNRLKNTNLLRPFYYSYETGDELILIDKYTKKKLNKKTGLPIEVRAFFKKKDKNKSGNRHKFKEDGIPVSKRESLLHQLGKTCFKENSLFKIKGLQVRNLLHDYNKDLVSHYTLLDDAEVIITHVETEVTIELKDNAGNKVIKQPDILLRCYHLDTDTYFDLYVEIAVTHKKSDEDIKIFRLNNLNVLEIDLSNLIELSKNISDADIEGAVTPKKFLHILRATVLGDLSKQKWLSNKLHSRYCSDMRSISVKPIRKCMERNSNQEGYLEDKCRHDSYRMNKVTIVNYTCFGCRNFVKTIGDYNYIKYSDKTNCEKTPYVICTPNHGLINPVTLELNIDSGYNNMT